MALDTIWKSKETSLMSKLAILRTCVFGTALYACEAWVVTAEIQRRILAFERICYRKVLRIGWRQNLRNEELYDRIYLEETLLQKVIRRKLQLFGHICRMDRNRKIKDIMFGMVEGANKKDDLTKNGWMTSGNGVRKLLYTNFIELLVLETSGIL